MAHFEAGEHPMPWFDQNLSLAERAAALVTAAAQAAAELTARDPIHYALSDDATPEVQCARVIGSAPESQVVYDNDTITFMPEPAVIPILPEFGQVLGYEDRTPYSRPADGPVIALQRRPSFGGPVRIAYFEADLTRGDLIRTVGELVLERWPATVTARSPRELSEDLIAYAASPATACHRRVNLLEPGPGQAEGLQVITGRAEQMTHRLHLKFRKPYRRSSGD